MIKNCTEGSVSLMSSPRPRTSQSICDGFNQSNSSKELSKNDPDLLGYISIDIDEKEASPSDSGDSINPAESKRNSPISERAQGSNNLGLELCCIDSKQVNKDFKYYTFESMTLKKAINTDSNYNNGTFSTQGSQEQESENIKVKKNFSLSRDYSFTEEPYENWSFIENRPHDSLSRENLLGALESLEGFSYSNSNSVRSTSRSQKLRYEEQLMGDDIQQVYASRLEFQQKIK